MAYQFAIASSQHLTVDAAPVTAVPLTLFVRHTHANLAGTARTNLALSSTASNVGSFSIYNRWDTPMQYSALVLAAASPGFDQAIAAVTVSADTWYNFTGVFTSNTARARYFNNSVQSRSNNYPAGTPTGITIGALRWNNSTAEYFNGNLADVAIWSTNLTADDIASLVAGFKPTRVRPQNLVFYAPLIRTLQDVRGGETITNVNTATVADHPRVY